MEAKFASVARIRFQGTPFSQQEEGGGARKEGVVKRMKLPNVRVYNPETVKDYLKKYNFIGVIP